MKPCESPAFAPTATDPYRGLVRVSCIINSIKDYRELLTGLLATTKEVMDCEAGSLMLYHEESNDLVWHIALGEKADKLKEMGRLPMGKGIAGWVAQNRKPALVPDTNTDERFFRGADTRTGFQTRSIICVPLELDGKLVGVLQALNPKNKKSFDERDLEIFEAYGSMAATAIEKIRWQEAMVEQARFKQDLEAAREIQARFLPQSLDGLAADLQLAFAYQPAQQVGGDFYDAQQTAGGAVALLFGDVTGKGMPAALLMAQILSEFRHQVPLSSDPSMILSRMNDALAAQSTRGMFATSWCGLARSVPGGIECVHACAGHPAPLRAGNGRAAFVEVQSGPPIGIAPGMEYPSSRIVLAPGEIVCLYTDGVTEGRDPAGQEYGTERLRCLAETWKGHAKSSAESVITDAKCFWNGAPQRDDVTLLLFGPKPR
ncbi:MAG: SpoIIE family protein phosphatase [Verrucomicrobiia bacterium]